MRRLSSRRTGPVHVQTERGTVVASAARGKDLLRIGLHSSPRDMSVAANDKVLLPPIKGLMSVSPVVGLAFSPHMRSDTRSAVDATRELRRAIPELFQFSIDARACTPRTQPTTPHSWQKAQIARPQPLLTPPRRPSTPPLAPIAPLLSPRLLALTNAALPGRSPKAECALQPALIPHPPSPRTQTHHRQPPSPRRPPLPTIQPTVTVAGARTDTTPLSTVTTGGGQQEQQRSGAAKSSARAAVDAPAAVPSHPPHAPASQVAVAVPPMATGGAAQPTAQPELAELAGEFWSGIHHALSPQALDMQWAAIRHAVASC